MNGAGLAPEAAYWDERYRREGKRWGDGPSELARLAVARLSFAAGRSFDLLDVGCGYGRDSLYLAAELGCRVLGIDPSPAAVSAARRSREPVDRPPRPKLRRRTIRYLKPWASTPCIWMPSRRAAAWTAPRCRRNCSNWNWPRAWRAWTTAASSA